LIFICFRKLDWLLELNFDTLGALIWIFIRFSHQLALTIKLRSLGPSNMDFWSLSLKIKLSKVAKRLGRTLILNHQSVLRDIVISKIERVLTPETSWLHLYILLLFLGYSNMDWWAELWIFEYWNGLLNPFRVLSYLEECLAIFKWKLNGDRLTAPPDYTMSLSQNYK